MHIPIKWLTLNFIFLIAAFVGIISITILSLWISGIFNTFSQLNTLGNHSVYHSEYALIKRCNWSMTRSYHFILVDAGLDSDQSEAGKDKDLTISREEVDEEAHGPCYQIPVECRSSLPYQLTSTFLPAAQKLNISSAIISSVDSCQEINVSFLCFLKYPERFRL